MKKERFARRRVGGGIRKRLSFSTASINTRDFDGGLNIRRRWALNGRTRHGRHGFRRGRNPASKASASVHVMPEIFWTNVRPRLACFAAAARFAPRRGFARATRTALMLRAQVRIGIRSRARATPNEGAAVQCHSNGQYQNACLHLTASQMPDSIMP